MATVVDVTNKRLSLFPRHLLVKNNLWHCIKGEYTLALMLICVLYVLMKNCITSYQRYQIKHFK